MSTHTRARDWLRAFRLPWRTPRRDVDDELEFHFAARITDLRATGLTFDEARHRAEEEFGNTEAVRSELISIDARIAHREQRARWWEQWAQDVRDAWRGIRRAPGFSMLTILTIGLGVGATTAVFTVADTLLLRPIAYRDASRVFVVRRETPNEQGFPFGPIPLALVRAWQANSTLLESSAIFYGGKMSLVTSDDSADVYRAIVDRGFFEFAGTPPLVGRTFSREEMLANGPAAVMISEALWRRQFGGSLDAIGRVVKVGDRERTIIGVVPARLALPDFRDERAQLWLPMSDDMDLVTQVVVRLKPGISREAASAEAAARLGVSPIDKPWNRDIKWRIGLVRPDEKLSFRSALTMLSWAVSLLLLIAFINVAHLLLARGATRERELAVRHALGASRSRLLRQLSTESLLLGVAGGALAASLAWGALRLMSAFRPQKLAALTWPSAGQGLIVTSAIIAVLTGLAVGMLSGFRVAHRNLARSLRAASTGGVRSRRFRGAMVVGEVGLSATLLVGALLLIHSVYDLARTELGFEARGLYRVRVPALREQSVDARLALAARVEDAARRLPGVEAVTIVEDNFTFLMSAFETPEHPPRGEVPGTSVKEVRPDFFPAMHMRLIAGRTFDAGSASRNDVIISRSLARSIWGDERPIGQRFRDTRSKAMRGELEAWKTVIGVVPDVVDNVLDRDGAPAIYQSLDLRAGGGGLTLAIRMHDPAAMPRLRAFATAARPPGAVGRPSQVESIEETIRLSMAEPRFTMQVLAAFAGVAMILAAVGLFGVISYGVKERTREIGVRMALGATRGGVARLVVGEGMRLALLGLALGLTCAAFASRLLDKMLYGVPKLDPFAFGICGLTLAVVSALACALPTLRATSVDPIVATRAE